MTSEASYPVQVLCQNRGQPRLGLEYFANYKPLRNLDACIIWIDSKFNSRPVALSVQRASSCRVQIQKLCNVQLDSLRKLKRQPQRSQTLA